MPLRAGIAEIEHPERVVPIVEEQTAVAGHTVTDLTHLIAGLTENAVRFSPPGAVVTIRARPYRPEPGGQLVTIEDCGHAGANMAVTNALLTDPPRSTSSVAQRFGRHRWTHRAAGRDVPVGSLVAATDRGRPGPYSRRSVGIEEEAAKDE